MEPVKPHDPRALGVDADTVSARVEEILATPADTLAEEVEQLRAAHKVLHDALNQ